MTRATTALDPKLISYIVAHCPQEHPVLAALREQTRVMPRASMQVSPEQGHFLGFLVKLCQARKVLELGTFTGYSSLAMALAMPADGRITTCDMSADWTKMAADAWARAGVSAKIQLRLGPGLETLAKLEAEGLGSSFDMAFIDANKEDYDGYYEGCLRLVKQGGLIILDNMFRDGRVTDAAIKDPSVTSIQALNAKIARDERVERVLIPVGDGIMLAIRR